MRTILLVVFLSITLILTACSPVIIQDTQTPTSEGTLHPYQISPITPTVTSSFTPTATWTPLPTSTPTPFTYKVLQSDDMGGIAYRFGVSVAALKTANPTVNPRAMGAGTILIIPATRIPTGMPSPTQVTPTSALAANSAPVCYPSQDSGMWCYMLVTNGQSYGLENLTGTISLISGNAASNKEQTATGFLNILPPGKAFPLAAFFPDQPTSSYQIEGQVTSALPQPANDTRYLPANIIEQQATMATDGKSARVTGKVSLTKGNPAAHQIWVLVSAYTSDGVVAGVRKWEASSELASGDNLPFDISVYSLGPEIDHIVCMVEARP
jgi:LysM repeat protein